MGNVGTKHTGGQGRYNRIGEGLKEFPAELCTGSVARHLESINLSCNRYAVGCIWIYLRCIPCDVKHDPSLYFLTSIADLAVFEIVRISDARSGNRSPHVFHPV